MRMAELGALDPLTDAPVHLCLGEHGSLSPVDLLVSRVRSACQSTTPFRVPDTKAAAGEIDAAHAPDVGLGTRLQRRGHNAGDIRRRLFGIEVEARCSPKPN